jgi:DNA anti-recombination protein RmuC
MTLVADAAKEGVLLVSPATLAINLNLLTVGLQAMEISEKAEQIQKKPRQTLHITKRGRKRIEHLIRPHQKSIQQSGEVDQKQTHLKNVFEQITQIEEQSQK